MNPKHEKCADRLRCIGGREFSARSLAASGMFDTTPHASVWIYGRLQAGSIEFVRRDNIGRASVPIYRVKKENRDVKQK